MFGRLREAAIRAGDTEMLDRLEHQSLRRAVVRLAHRRIDGYGYCWCPEDWEERARAGKHLESCVELNAAYHADWRFELGTEVAAASAPGEHEEAEFDEFEDGA